MNPRRTCLFAAALTLPLLSACTVSREVEVYNHASRPVLAEVLVHYPGGAVTTSQSARIAPGDRMTLGPVLTKPELVVVFRAGVVPADRPPAWRHLPVGTTIVEVVGGGEGAPLDIREPAPAPAHSGSR